MTESKTANAENHNYLRVGNTYFLHTNESDGETYHKREKPTIKLETGWNKDNIEPNIEKNNGYIAFKVEPSHLKYQQDIPSKEIKGGKYRNLYQQLPKKPIKGDWPTIELQFRHLFQGQYKHILDYLWVAMHHPEQDLFPIALLSNEQGTGKTEFQNTIHQIFGGNVVSVDPEDLTGSWNDHYIASLFCCIDEAFFDSKSTMNRLKYLSTTKRTFLKKRFTDSTSFEPFMKFIICSNEELKFAKLEMHDRRWWVRKIAPFDKQIIGFHEKVKSEIPAFLHYLIKEHPEPEKVSNDFWLCHSVTNTHTKSVVQRESIEQPMIDLLYKLKEILHNTKDVEAGDGIYFRGEHLQPIVNQRATKKLSIQYINRLLKTITGQTVGTQNKQGILKATYDTDKTDFSIADLNLEYKLDGDTNQRGFLVTPEIIEKWLRDEEIEPTVDAPDNAQFDKEIESALPF